MRIGEAFLRSLIDYPRKLDTATWSALEEQQVKRDVVDGGLGVGLDVFVLLFENKSEQIES